MSIYVKTEIRTQSYLLFCPCRRRRICIPAPGPALSVLEPMHARGLRYPRFVGLISYWKGRTSVFKASLLRVALCLSLITACAPRVTTTGNLPAAERLSEIDLGETRKRDVADLLGSPSIIPAFDQNVWLYVSQRREEIAFFEPEITDQKVVLIRFDERDQAISIARYTLADSREVEPSERVTPTSGKDLTVLQQMFGNLGRFTNTDK